MTRWKLTLWTLISLTAVITAVMALGGTVPGSRLPLFFSLIVLGTLAVRTMERRYQSRLEKMRFELERSLSSCTKDLTRTSTRYRSLFEQAPNAIFVCASDETILEANRAAEALSGYPRETLRGLPFGKLLSKTRAPGQHWPAQESEWAGKVIRGDGSERSVKVSQSLISMPEADNLQYIVRDVTEQELLEKEFLQAQKMEGIGRLAAGVAHDFNNLLTAINGYSQLALDSLAADAPARELIQEVGEAGKRATHLTRQLLAFSRRQIVERRVVDVNEIMVGMSKIVRRLIGEDIELSIVPAPAPLRVWMDPGQIDQVLVNLAVNARDAMPEGGKLLIEAGTFSLPQGQGRRSLDLKPGEYVSIRVVDTGTGMSEEVRAHLFEPFFTTKQEGAGTGLGLATCHGIIKQNQGEIEVDTEPGRGTTFTIYLPRVRRDAGARSAPEDTPELPRGTETILLAEDDDSVRWLTVHVLRGLGYKVLEAANGEEALGVLQKHSGSQLDLLLTDVVMPQMGGRKLARKLQERIPSLKVIFASGYTAELSDPRGILHAGVEFLPKPFTPRALALKVREVLDSPAGARLQKSA